MYRRTGDVTHNFVVGDRVEVAHTMSVRADAFRGLTGSVINEITVPVYGVLIVVRWDGIPMDLQSQAAELIRRIETYAEREGTIMPTTFDLSDGVFPVSPFCLKHLPVLDQLAGI